MRAANDASPFFSTAILFDSALRTGNREPSPASVEDFSENASGGPKTGAGSFFVETFPKGAIAGAGWMPSPAGVMRWAWVHPARMAAAVSMMNTKRCFVISEPQLSSVKQIYKILYIDLIVFKTYK